MDVLEWIRARGGIAHRRDLAAAGWQKHHLRDLTTVGRMWVVVGDPPPEFVRAAAERGALACVSAAAHLGLALLHQPALLHLQIGPGSEQLARPGIRLHRSRPLVPTARTALIESVPDMLSHVAGCLPELEALIVWESALNRGLLVKEELVRIAWPGPRQRRLVDTASSRSDSLLETMLAHQLRRAGIRFEQQVRLLGRPVDALIGERLVVQVDGFEHHRAAQRRSDIAFDAELMLRGWHVIRADYAQVVEDRVVPVVQRALAQRLHA